MKALLLATLALAAMQAQAQSATEGNTPDKRPGQRCQIQNNTTGNVLPPGAHDDALFKLLSAQPRCPGNALEFRNLVLANKMSSRPSMVANRGFHNPLPQGSFSFFESIDGSYAGQKLVPGDWFYGHFTAASIDNTALTSILSPQQAATPDNLLLETLVWDPRKQMYNFYEIRGTGQGGQWFYRGDSADIQADIANLWRAYDPSQPIFMGPPDSSGKATLPRLRCSGCHMNGGPIMKELAFPHDSWWRPERPLPLGAMRIAPEYVTILDNLVSSEIFSGWIKAGNEKLASSPAYMKQRSALSLQEQLRPIFCEQEVNLDSDLLPFEGPATTIKAPIGAFVDQRLAGDIKYIEIDKTLYTNSLNLFQAQFFDYQSGSFQNSVQPINQIDADHAFETPVKSHTDRLLAQKMVASGLIDEKFLYDVLAIDPTRPMFSPQRCGLLQLVPGGGPTPNWRTQFTQALTNAGTPAAKALLANMNDPARTPEWHRNQVKQILTRVQSLAQVQLSVNGFVRLLAGRRIAVYQAQISQHPQGQIFEPGFRLIFPTMQLFQKNQQQIAYGGVPDQYWLNPVTGAVELVP
ncbi:MAG: hypothetical protein AMXMBFR59_34280 [Rhodanobacteraceae bacterium]